MSAPEPADIIKAARRTYDALGRGSISDSERIALAILAERNRCAQIVENNEEVIGLKTNNRSLSSRTEGNQVGLAYAAAIRNPTGE